MCAEGTVRMGNYDVPIVEEKGGRSADKLLNDHYSKCKKN